MLAYDALPKDFRMKLLTATVLATFIVQTSCLADENMRTNFASQTSSADLGDALVRSRTSELNSQAVGASYTCAWHVVKDIYYNQRAVGPEWARWEHRYDGKLRTWDDERLAIMSMLASLNDPCTRLLDRSALDESRSQLHAEISGVGMGLVMNRRHEILVFDVNDGSPSQEAGIKPGDRLTEVDGKPIKGESLNQVVQQVKGPAGTKVTVTLLRSSLAPPLQQAPEVSSMQALVRRIPLTRALIPIQAITSVETLPGDIGYIRLHNLNSIHVAAEMRQALMKISKCAKLVLDLRDCHGEESPGPATEIAGMFVGPRTIVTMIDSEGYATTTVGAKQLYSGQLLILINEATIQYAELLAAALKDDLDATIVGQSSFGLALGQATANLGNAAGLRVTAYKWLRPSHQDILWRGITPDVEVQQSAHDYFHLGNPDWFNDRMYRGIKPSTVNGNDRELKEALELLRE
jgi:carboxyl-terminal processing protease